MTFDEAMRILAAHGIVRATRDIDIFVNPGEDNIARLRIWEEAWRFEWRRRGCSTA